MLPDTYQPDHNNLLYAIRNNNEQLLQQLYITEYPKAERYVIEKGGNVEQAKDVFQEAFVAVWRNIKLGRFQPQSQSAWAAYLYQVVKNKWIDYLRSAHHKNTMPVSNLPNGFDKADELPQEQHPYLEAVKNAFKQLGENCREVLNRFYYKNEPVQAIAEAMEWTEATVRNNKYRCMEKLREMLKQK